MQKVILYIPTTIKDNTCIKHDQNALERTNALIIIGYTR